MARVLDGLNKLLYRLLGKVRNVEVSTGSGAPREIDPGADRLRPSEFAGLREDENPREVVKEHGGES